ncbi:MAG: phosphopentomutase [Rhizobiales bacterium]|nr:phosphopentomutase [Hyphomicrobiales bacterium]MBI3673022.1 phosphopentomutase [Hyphomicrobiales bacterium]
MARAILFVLDSCGIGGAPDAAKFGDEGANTLLHIAERMTLKLPNLSALGLGLAIEAVSGRNPLAPTVLKGQWGHAREVSNGKDTITGHWEIAGVPVPFDWGYLPHTIPAFPADFTEALIARCGLPGLLALRHASGTAVIEDYGEEHLASGKPIVYTSADSVIQIAAHEESFGLQRLYEVCQVARELSYPMNIGRVIARPFVGTVAADFTRTGNRKDYAVLPPSPTLLDCLTSAGRAVVSVGKIGDIFAHSGTGREIKVAGHEALMQASLEAIEALPDDGLVMTNFVDFDTNFGHRRDATGYGRALERFDAMLPMVFDRLRPGDLLILTADHGNDPTWQGTDHTREQVPILGFGPGLKPRALGARASFADIGQSLARHLGIVPLASGKAW